MRIQFIIAGWHMNQDSLIEGLINLKNNNEFINNPCKKSLIPKYFGKLPYVRWMKKFITALQHAKLNRIKTISILYQIIEGLGLDIREIQMYIPKIKAQIRRDKGKQNGEDEAEEGSY